jgi:hypothetical protein
MPLRQSIHHTSMSETIIFKPYLSLLLIADAETLVLALADLFDVHGATVPNLSSAILPSSSNVRSVQQKIHPKLLAFIRAVDPMRSFDDMSSLLQLPLDQVNVCVL